jgi:tRNA C32,U32 (ribose-2'-O)-methylase TrmJ
MNNPPFTKKSSTPSKSNRAERASKRIKAPAEDGLEAQLAGCEASGEAETGINYDGTSHETTPAETASVETLVVLPAQTVEPTEIVDEPASRANRKMMSKLRRAFRKAGKSEASETEIMAFLTSLLQANVPVLNRSSGRIAKVVRGAENIENLLLTRVSPKSA